MPQAQSLPKTTSAAKLIMYVVLFVAQGFNTKRAENAVGFGVEFIETPSNIDDKRGGCA